MQWFKCKSCGRASNVLLVSCISCGQVLEPWEGLAARPRQEPLFLLPVLPRPVRWKIEWKWTPACIQNTLEIFHENLPEGWFFHSEYTTERQAVNALVRLRRRDRPTAYCHTRARHYHMMPSLWHHNGDIEIALPEAPAGTYDPDTPTIDEVAAEIANQIAVSAAKMVDQIMKDAEEPEPSGLPELDIDAVIAGQ